MAAHGKRKKKRKGKSGQRKGVGFKGAKVVNVGY